MRLPTKSLFDIRGLSKTSLNIVDDPFFATLHTQRILNSATAPVEVAQLVLFVQIWSFEDEKCLTALQSLKYNMHRLNKNEDASTKIFSSEDYYEVDFVFCNLFGFINNSGRLGYSCLLVNPLRGEVLEIPMNDLVPTDHTNWDDIKWYGMGFDSITSTHKIVCIAQSASFGFVSAYVYTLGSRSSSWREIHSVPQCEFTRKNVSAYGDMHWLIESDVDGGSSNHIISFDFKKEEFVWIPYPNSSQGFNHGLYAMHLLNLRGRLAILSSGDFSLEIWVLKSYEDKKWTLDYKIKNKMFPHHAGNEVRSIDSCGEWEHGIFFTEEDPPMFYFWDARYKSLKYIKAETLFPSIFNYENLYYHVWKGQLRCPPKLRIFNYTRSLISLKTFGNLVKRQVCRRQIMETTKSRTWHFNLGDWTQ
ncbi:PREDICTED: F-box protein CPR30-like [Prunus mume]|uniref:F-box protein CPR30-like n=1 Tax=Prunus mume TaxID=102107 RepID=A0ABM0PNZ0_PRUMU|nr:PREDICTED: F-box protein CPR30-like [Prunus mume]